MVEPAPLQPLGELRRRARHVEAESIGETREETGEETAPPLRPSPVEVTPLLRGRGPGAGAAATERRRTALFEQVRSDPLSADGYADLAVFFAELGDTQRAHLMEELAEALEGRPSREPPPPTLLLGAVDRAGLRHPSLRNEVGALLGDLGPALCRWLGRAEEPEAGPKLHAGAGPGAPAAVASLRAASRVLGIAAPDTAVVADAPLPLALSCAGGAPRLLVSRALFSEAQSASVLRFHAARALYGLCPDLLPLCCLKGGELSRGLTAAGALLSGDDDERDARALGVELTGAARLSAQAAWQRLRRSLEPALLKESAQISLDRAGLVACGSVGIALAAVRELGAAPRRITDLVRFAASERHLRYREPRAEASASSRPQ